MSPVPEVRFSSRGASRRLAGLAAKELNFDPDRMVGSGWRRDDYRQSLPAEPPGDPIPGGSFEVARRLSRDFAFSDPSLVEAFFDRDAPFAGRNMLLVLHVLGLRIDAGVRVHDDIEERCEIDGRPVLVSAWSYRTLEGHPESGQRDYEVRKWLDTGEVDFRTHSLSRPAPAHPVIRVGVLLLGRQKQAEFGRRALARMAFLTASAQRRPDADGAFEQRLFVIHLRDRHALVVGLRAIAARLAGGTAEADERDFARDLAAAADDDLAALDVLLRSICSSPSRTKDAGVRVGELLGRLKLNGSLVRRSPLASVTELEACRLLLAGAADLWNGLAALGLGPDDAAERAERARTHHDAAEALRLAALARAVRPA